MKAPIIKLCWFSLVVTLLVAPTTGQADGVSSDGKLSFYHIPNPFNNPEENGFYYIKSHQTVISRQSKRTTLEVHEYFSLTKGFTYSIYRDLDGGGEYALTSDGKNDRSYIIHNPDEENENLLACELDSVHNHRQIFPWQFNYDLTLNDENRKEEVNIFSKTQKKRKKKGAWSSKRSVYGVGAIWLNAIELGVVSDKVADKSPYPDSQPWVINQNDLNVELRFDKPKEAKVSPERMQAAIDATRLAAVHIKRRLSPDTFNYAGIIKGASEDEIIEIDEFVADLNIADYGIKRMFSHLRHCRRENQEHRVFPSLMRAISLSPKHMYELDYLETRFGELATAKFDNKFRRVHNPELIFELFSVPHESQITDYQGVVDETNGLYDERVDSYLKRFTERADGTKSTRRGTVEYHIVRETNKTDYCSFSEPDPPPKWFNLLLRPYVFWRPNNVKITGLLTGLGALLMNVNDIHYKEYNLLQKTIEVVTDAANVKSRVKIKVEEWRLTDVGGGKQVHFYFKQPISAKANYDLTSLVRAEVRQVSYEQKEAVVQNASDDDLNDEDLIIRWDILGFYVDDTDEHLSYFFEKPYFCPKYEKPTGKQDSDKSNIDVVTLPSLVSDNDRVNDGKPDESEEEQVNDKDRKQGEDFELEPGMATEENQIPDFFEQFGGHTVSYSAVSKVELSNPTTNSKTLYLREIVNMGLYITRISVFYGEYNEQATPDLDYYLNYNSEVLLKINTQLDNCEIAEKLESWLRLLSVDLAYWRKNPSGSVTEESHKLRHYGVGALWRHATMSGETKFVGQSHLRTDEIGQKYKRLYWSGFHQGDFNMPLMYEFQLNITDGQKDDESPMNALSLKSIQFDNFFPTSDYESSCESIKITVLQFQSYLSEELTIPQKCQPALAKLSVPFFDENSALPTFENFLGDATGYRAQYYVTRADAVKADGVNMEQFQETYDIKTRKGTIISGSSGHTKAVFVDGGCIYLFAQESCKLLSTIAAFKTGLDLVDFHHDSDPDALFGLANIWQMAGTLGKPVRKTFTQYDKFGNYKKTSIYFIVVETDKGNVKIRFEFDIREGDVFYLEKIAINEMLSSNQKIRSTKLSTTIINVMYIHKIREDEMKWILPNECSDLCKAIPNKKDTTNTSTDSTSDATQDTSGSSSEEDDTNPNVEDDSDSTESTNQLFNLNELPDITKVIAPLGKFYMRSEVVLPRESFRLSEKVNNYHIMDEWYLDGDYRIKSYAMARNYDEIIYTSTDEQFDISEQHLCVSKHEVSHNLSRVLPPLLKVWKGYRELPVSLLDYHFGPTSIWRLAEANKDSLKMISYIDFTPTGSSIEERNKELELEMGTRVWQLSHPDGLWHVDLEFNRESGIDHLSGRRIEWLVLNGITINEKEESKVNKIEIEVVNYEYSKNDEQMQQKLLLPEGYGCQRSPKKMDSLSTVLESAHIFQTLAHSIWYETTLEKIELSQSDYGITPEKSKTILPSITGTFHRSSRQIIKPHLNIWSNLNTVRYSNGTIQSTKTVHDISNRIHYSIDRMTGDCQMTLNSYNWTIKYPSHDDGTEETLVLDDDTFNRLFMREGDFQPLNKYERRGTVYISYEETGDKLDLTSNLSGPYSIIRRYQYSRGASPRNTKRFNSMLVKVFMFDKRRVDKKAILTFNIRRMANVAYHNILDTIDVSSCFNDGDELTENPIRTFAIEYVCNKKDKDSLQKRSTESIKDSFFSTFIQGTGIYATQMVGKPKLEINNNGLIKFTLQLIDAPTFILQDTKYYPKMRMCNEHESMAQVKLTANIAECSRLCDNLKCLALSYCSNHFCYIITRQDISNSSLVLLDSPLPDADCDYFFLEHQSARTVDSLTETFEQIKSDEATAEILPLWTGQYCGMLYPSRVTVLTEPLDTEQSAAVKKQFIANRYNEVGRNKMLDLVKLSHLNEQGFSESLESVESISECINRCEQQDCVMVSFCKSELVKCVVLTGSGDLKALANVVGEASQEGCMVLARDYTSEFKRFTNTRKPTSSALEYQGLSDKECAGECVLLDANPNKRCLSFDHCLIKSAEGEVQPTCFIQTTHLYSDVFERTVFEGTRNKSDTGGGDEQSCQHFSRNFLADYQKLANRRLKVKYAQIEEGVEADKCAYNCNNEDQCYAFVHCSAKTDGICLMMLDNDEKQFKSKDEVLKYFNSETRESNTCSIYVRNNYFQSSSSAAIGEGALMSLGENSNWLKFLIKVTIYLHVALIGGIAIRVISLRLG